MRLLQKVTCPHCWSLFAPHEAVWISEHAELQGDPLLGMDFPRRFLPDRFDPYGAAIDFRGMPCRRLACPQCHLEVPRANFECPPLFLSVVGAPASGKSFFLTSMCWRLRAVLPRLFKVTIVDADNLFNRRLQEFESVLFLNPNKDDIVTLPKTEVHGDLYFNIVRNGQPMQFLKPFIFKLAPTEGHPLAEKDDFVGRTLCVYDNAGESFLPGMDSFLSPVTRHLATCDCMFFIFDPLQDSRIRERLGLIKSEEDVGGLARVGYQKTALRQETLLFEAASRAERFAPSLGRSGRIPRLIVVLTKFDAWCSLLKAELPYPIVKGKDVFGVAVNMIEDVSAKVKALMSAICPEFVGAAQAVCDNVTFVPVSATGTQAEKDAATQSVGFRPSKIVPIWVEVPMLYFLSQSGAGLVGYVKTSGKANG